MDINWDIKTRYRLIEAIALWEGRVNTSHLMRFFAIAREKASKPTANFSPKVTKGLLDEYQHLVVRNSGHLSDITTGFDAIHAPVRNITPHLVLPILSACREHLRLDIG